METRSIILPFFVSVLVAIVITYLVITYLPLVIAGVWLIIVAAIIFSVVLGAIWFILRLLLFYLRNCILKMGKELLDRYGHENRLYRVVV